MLVTRVLVHYGAQLCTSSTFISRDLSGQAELLLMSLQMKYIWWFSVLLIEERLSDPTTPFMVLSVLKLIEVVCGPLQEDVAALAAAALHSVDHGPGVRADATVHGTWEGGVSKAEQGCGDHFGGSEEMCSVREGCKYKRHHL